MQAHTITAPLSAAHGLSPKDILKGVREVQSGATMEIFSHISEAGAFESLWLVSDDEGEFHLLSYTDPNKFPIRDRFGAWI